jgi:hypothetical protein
LALFQALECIKLSKISGLGWELKITEQGTFCLEQGIDFLLQGEVISEEHKAKGKP